VNHPVQPLLHPGDVVIDAGANVGTHTLALQKSLDRQARFRFRAAEIYDILWAISRPAAAEREPSGSGGTANGTNRLHGSKPPARVTSARCRLGQRVEVPLIAIDSRNCQKSSDQGRVEGAETDVLRARLRLGVRPIL
jgi:hypothetical protein